MAILAIQWQAFISALRREMALAQDNHQVLALVLIEIRQFHIFNVEYGFEYGEAVASEALSRIKSSLKKEAPIFRTGANSLALILPDLSLPELLPVVAQKLFTQLSAPFLTENRDLTTKPAIGIAFFPEHGGSAEELMAEAEYSLQRALSTALPYAIASRSNSAKRLQGTKIEKDLQQAIGNDHLHLYYQPQIDFSTLQPVAAEALMRLAVPDRSAISPERFIPLAESSGTIAGLTEWALHTALRELAELAAPPRPLSVSVNVSAASIYDPGLTLTVESALAIWGVDPGRLTIEVTESTLMKNPDLCFQHLSSLRALGVNIAIDDFGTGFSSLSYFKTIPADEIKIDQSFVKNMVEGNDDAKIVELIIDLCHKFGLRVVAEGIESHQVFELLQALGCDYGQGYHVARPMPYPAYQQWLNDFGKGTLASHGFLAKTSPPKQN